MWTSVVQYQIIVQWSISKKVLDRGLSWRHSLTWLKLIWLTSANLAGRTKLGNSRWPCSCCFACFNGTVIFFLLVDGSFWSICLRPHPKVQALMVRYSSSQTSKASLVTSAAFTADNAKRFFHKRRSISRWGGRREQRKSKETANILPVYL